MKVIRYRGELYRRVDSASPNNKHQVATDLSGLISHSEELARQVHQLYGENHNSVLLNQHEGEHLAFLCHSLHSLLTHCRRVIDNAPHVSHRSDSLRLISHSYVRADAADRRRVKHDDKVNQRKIEAGIVKLFSSVHTVYEGATKFYKTNSRSPYLDDHDLRELQKLLDELIKVMKKAYNRTQEGLSKSDEHGGGSQSTEAYHKIKNEENNHG